MKTGSAPAEDNNPKPQRLWLVPMLLFTALGIAAIFLPVSDAVDHFRNRMDALGWAGPIAFILLVVILTVCLVPGAAVVIAAGSLFGLVRGTLYSVIGCNLGTLAAFLLARTVLRKRVEAWARGHPRFDAVDTAIARNGFKFVLLLRLSPVFPFCMLNYVLGLTRVSTASYALGGLIGMLPGTILFVYIGVLSSSLGGVPANETQDVWRLKLALKIVGFLATLVVTWWITRVASTELKAQDNPPAAPQPTE